MPANYVLLREITLTATTSFITFSNIPSSGYTDLKLVASARALRTGFPADDLVIQFNGVTTGYSGKRLYSNSTTLSTDSPADIRGFASDADETAGVFGSNEFYIPNYLSSEYKSVLIDMVTETNGASAPLGIFAGLWSNTAAINSIKIFANNSNMVANSTFQLYGLAAVGTAPSLAPFATGGDAVVNDGTYWYHAFLASGTFTPAKALSCDALVVAGGGGTGVNFSAGGGAGGLLAFTGESLSANTQLSCIVGAGGAGSAVSGGTKGNNSQFASLTASVGGGSGMFGGNSKSGGSTGGSGGGATDNITAGFAGTAGQGNAGGGASGSTNGGTGGGGGAGAAGTAGTFTVSGNGGIGVNTYSSWASVTSTGDSGYFAGGGGGGAFSGNQTTRGTGGTGGGGSGGRDGSHTASAGTANTGGGGGGAGANSAAGTSGGSGIIIIRYPMA